MWEWKTSGSTASSKKDSGEVWLKKREGNEDYFTSKNISNKSKQLLRALSAKNDNHLQTTCTLKRHQRYSIRYHCGWPSLGIWGSDTHYGLPALPEPFLRACGLHRVCTGHKKIKTAEPLLRDCGLHRACTGTKNQNSRAILACLRSAQGISPNQNSFQGHYPQRMPFIYKPRTR